MKVCIAGGGKVGMYLAQSLLAHHHKVTIIEPQEALCRSLADSLDVPVVCGDAISFDTLRTADVASCDAFVAVTGNDEDNLVACQIAKREFGVDRTVARSINNQLGDRTIIPADTAYHHFQNSNLTEGLTGHYNYLANMGSPRMSRIFFERRDPEPTIFMEPFSSFFIRPTEFNFTNSNVPYTNLTYHKAGNKINGEERFKSYFSVNVNKKLAFGFNIDYLYGRGYYNP